MVYDLLLCIMLIYDLNNEVLNFLINDHYSSIIIFLVIVIHDFKIILQQK